MSPSRSSSSSWFSQELGLKLSLSGCNLVYFSTQHCDSHSFGVCFLKLQSPRNQQLFSDWAVTPASSGKGPWISPFNIWSPVSHFPLGFMESQPPCVQKSSARIWEQISQELVHLPRTSSFSPHRHTVYFRADHSFSLFPPLSSHTRMVTWLHCLVCL